MLDTLQYNQNQDLSITRTVQSIVVNLESEIIALQAQLLVFQQSQQTPDIIAAIQNYTSQISVLQIILPPTNVPIPTKITPIKG